MSAISAKLYRIIETTDTTGGRIFAATIILLVIVSVTLGILDGSPFYAENRHIFNVVDTIIVIVFSIEYILRLSLSKNPLKKAVEFLTIIDLLAILPFYVALFIPHIEYNFLFLRLFRMFRIFRILKITRYSNALNSFMRVMKINFARFVTVFFVAAILTVAGAFILYNVEPSLFTNVSDAFWWSILTVTSGTYGMGVFPQTLAGKFIAVLFKVIGIGLIAVPTGIIASGMSELYVERICPVCGRSGHSADAGFCKYCGASLKYSVKVCERCGNKNHDPDAKFCELCGGKLFIEGVSNKQEGEIL